MGRKTHTRESIIQTLQSLAKSLKKDTLSMIDLGGVISPSSINNHFGSVGNALEAAGLRRRAPHEVLEAVRRTLSDDDLFEAVLEVETTLGHEPRSNEFSANGRISLQPFRRRFGTWEESLAFYRKWKSETGAVVHCGASADPIATPDKVGTMQSDSDSMYVISTSTIKPPMQFYGEPIDFRGLRHAPINEQGVVYLFGMVSRELGFYIEAVQQGFPDCEGKYLYDPKRSLWAKARIEFEFKASNFRQHGHDPNQCDFVICWENDWPDCPINVIELRKEILKLPSR
ncbi:MAG: hypothetical protein SFU86_18860 [Pirellulaceae bacterium]|nr:hypothetical protein [Pirellulaceae bacterium]